MQTTDEILAEWKAHVARVFAVGPITPSGNIAQWYTTEMPRAIAALERLRRIGGDEDAERGRELRQSWGDVARILNGEDVT